MNQSKGVASVRSRVKNLMEFDESITTDTLMKNLTDLWVARYPGTELEILTKEIVDSWMEQPHFAEIYNQMRVSNFISAGDFQDPHLCVAQDWDWIYGETPNFDYNLEHRFQWGIMVRDIFKLCF
jgi:lipoate---protein ligase